MLLSIADSMEGGLSLGDHTQSNTSRPTTGMESIMSDMESSRPVTGVSELTASRPGTSASSFIHDDDGDETREPAQAMEVSADDKHAFFSLVRHNKVPEVEDKVHTYTHTHHKCALQHKHCTVARTQRKARFCASAIARATR